MDEPRHDEAIEFADEIEAAPMSASDILRAVRPLHRALYLTAAATSFTLGVVGIVVPGVPTVPFVLLTSFFLLRGSPQLNARLHRSTIFGPMLRDWQRHRGVRRRVKLVSFATIAATLAISLVLLSTSAWATLGVGVLALIGLGVVWRVPTIPD